HPALQEAARFPFPTRYTEKSRDLAIVTRRNRLRVEPWAYAVDGPPSLRRRVMDKRISGGVSLFELVRDEKTLEEFVRERSHGTWHCCGTARMGVENDPHAVTSSNGQVYGVGKLRVADASLMPTVPRANTNLPTIMIAEKISAAILSEWGS
ncbi:MAG: GMC oxidoreductase, partial [Thermomicrobiales bacterium]